ncbi:MAG TPA: DUF4307 domain-containing protein [Pseudolysinimonas sp.]|nr:hypothetical protein [Schumannella sp.]HEV7742858.1 DUF4307 domain-containing protein [Pseudolysinimonas sp.]
MNTSTIDARYGRTPGRSRRSRLIAIVAAAGVVVVVVAWVLWVGLFGPASGLGSRDLGYVIHGDSAVEVRYEVTVDAGRSASCALQALNSDFGVVGWKVVDIPPSTKGTRQFRETLRTSETAVTGLIYRCWLT